MIPVITYSSCWTVGAVGDRCVVGGLAHGADRPFLLLIRWHFGGSSKQQDMKTNLPSVNTVCTVSNSFSGSRSQKTGKLGGHGVNAQLPSHSSEVKALCIMRSQHGLINQTNYSQYVGADNFSSSLTAL